MLEYARHAGARRSEDRAADEAKDGRLPGDEVTNPVNGEKAARLVADYVLMDYGTGAIMGVPAHDTRDFEFARTFDLPVRTVVAPRDGDVPEEGAVLGAHRERGARQLGRLHGHARAGGEGGDRRAAARGGGEARPRVVYRLRDWSFSRQRYWGCSDSDHPLRGLRRGAGARRGPAAPAAGGGGLPAARKAPAGVEEEWMRVRCPRCGGEALREADTMDTFVDSSWYFLRYVDPRNDEAPFGRALVDYWLPISQYIGGIDHATGHLLYSRFFVKALHDMGLLGFREPFARLFHQGWVQMGGTKMSKTKGNVTGPDEFVEEYGADAVRLSILFLGPADQDMEWTPTGIEGMARFVRRLWRIVHEVAERAPAEGDAGELTRKAHETIARVTDDIGRRFHFNTPIAAVMELVNELAKDTTAPDARFAAETAVSLIQPYAPHVAEDLWQLLGHERLWEQAWPEADEAMLQRETLEIVLQVNGKLRDRLEVPASIGEEELVALARASERVRAHLDGGEPRKTIVVPGKLVNFVV